MNKMKCEKDYSKMCTIFMFLMSHITHPYIF